MNIPTTIQFPSLQFRTKKFVIYLFIPLILSAFTHLWNPIGFPAFDQDEGHYMRRAMQVIHGLGPQESKETFFYEYDHPYFGQIFLAAALSLVNYPYSLNPSINLHSIEMLYLVPRVLMGILAVVDTFLVYKIAETRYNRKVAFISSTLFAVMPLSWFLRRIYLDSILLPFLLLSILFAIYYAKSESHYSHIKGSNKNIILILLSGIFLGLAIFTKLPVFTMVPLIVFIILKKENKSNKDNNDRGNSSSSNIKTSNRLKALGIWFMPVVLIPIIWPAYAISNGQFHDWLDGVIWQGSRADRPLATEINNVFRRMDPVLLTLGAVGLIYAVIKRDYFLLLWAFPYLIFFYFVDWFYFFHLIPVFAAFCIVATTLLMDLLRNIYKYKRLWQSLEFAVFGFILIFGFINTTMLIIQNPNYSNFRLASFLIKSLPDKNNAVDNSSDKVTMIGPNGAWSLYWIVSEVFNRNTEFKWFEGNRDYVGVIKTEKFLIIVDREIRDMVSSNSTKPHIKYVTQLYNKSNVFGVFALNITLPDLEKYPYTSILDEVDKIHKIRRGVDWSERIEVTGNY